MPRDERADEIGEWLARAYEDLRAIEVGLAATPPLLGDAAFHCQQAVEKALKAFLTCHDHIFPRTLVIAELARACLEHDAALETTLDRSLPLSEYAWRFRYPGDVVEPERGEVEGALVIARDVVREVEAAVAGGC